MKTFTKRMEAIPASFLSCDINGAPVDEYIAKWKAVAMAEAADGLNAELLEALREILRVHADDNARPKAIYIASEALEKAEAA